MHESVIAKLISAEEQKKQEPGGGTKPLPQVLAKNVNDRRQPGVQKTV
jgi:hypothetical protein